MLIPKQFQLGAHTWTVVHSPGMFNAPDGDTCRGYCDFYNLTVTVNIAQPDSLVRHTFMHEVMHAVLWTLAHPLAEDESFVDSVSGALAQVLQSSV